MTREFYKILDIDSDATQEEVKKAYRKKTLLYHPDKNQGNADATKKFHEVTNAYEILSNPKKREIYDKFGEKGLEREMNNPFQQDVQRHAMQAIHKITLEEYFTQYSTKVKIPIDKQCVDCDSTGFSDKKKHYCKSCGGSGMMIVEQHLGPGMKVQQRMPCHYCRGNGKDVTDAKILCKTCNGKGTKKHYDHVDVPIPRNINISNTQIVHDCVPIDENTKIDLAVVFKLKYGKNFSITDDRKLLYNLHINLTESLCGFTRKINHPNGQTFLIVSDQGCVISPNYIYSVPGYGFKNDDDNGYDIMYLSFVIHYPDTIKIPKKKALTFNSLETTMGPRRVENYTDEEETLSTFNLQSLTKRDDDKRMSKDDSENDDDDEENFFENGDVHHVPGCAQQ